MQQIAKYFANNLNKALDDLDVPSNSRERSNILSKMLHIPKQQAWSLLEGHLMPDANLLQHIATELELDPEVLLKSDENKYK